MWQAAHVREQLLAASKNEIAMSRLEGECAGLKKTKNKTVSLAV